MAGMTLEGRRHWVVEERRRHHMGLREAKARLAEAVVKLEKEEVSPDNTT